jgi:hypothetical protein
MGVWAVVDLNVFDSFADISRAGLLSEDVRRLSVFGLMGVRGPDGCVNAVLLENAKVGARADAAAMSPSRPTRMLVLY